MSSFLVMAALVAARYLSMSPYNKRPFFLVSHYKEISHRFSESAQCEQSDISLLAALASQDIDPKGPSQETCLPGAGM